MDFKICTFLRIYLPTVCRDWGVLKKFSMGMERTHDGASLCPTTTFIKWLELESIYSDFWKTLHIDEKKKIRRGRDLLSINIRLCFLDIVIPKKNFKSLARMTGRKITAAAVQTSIIFLRRPKWLVMERTISKYLGVNFNWLIFF